MDQDFIVTTLAFTGIGAVFAGVRKLLRRQKEESQNLGYDWEMLKGDEDLTLAMYQFKKTYRKFNPQAYYNIGCALNAIVEIWVMVNDPQTEERFTLEFQASKHLHDIIKEFKAIESSIKEFRRQNMFNPTMDLTGEAGLLEFHKHADEIVKMAN